MKPHLPCLRIILLAITALSLPLCAAEPPGILNHQGRIAVSGTNFDGTGYFKFALVDAAGTTTFWSNDSTSTGGAAPSAAVSIPVSKGHYAVGLGDTSVANMTTAIAASVFSSHTDIRLRVWFSADGTTFEQLAPDRRITSAGYALSAASVTGGSVSNPTFLGTTTNAPFDVSVNNLRVLRLQPAGGSGTETPSIIGGFSGNSIDSESGGAAILGGGTVANANSITGSSDFSTIIGGYSNSIESASDRSLIGSGIGNSMSSSDQSFIGAGFGNQLSNADWSVIGGGYQNVMTSDQSVIAGGRSNQVYSDWSVIGGGRQNSISINANWSTIPGGLSNSVTSSYGFAAGRRAKANHQGAFVWADSTDADFLTTANDQFLIRAAGGVGIGTSAPQGLLHAETAKALAPLAGKPIILRAQPGADGRRDPAINFGSAGGAIEIRAGNGGDDVTFVGSGGNVTLRAGDAGGGGGGDGTAGKILLFPGGGAGANGPGSVGIGTSSPGSTLEVTETNVLSATDGTGLISAGSQSGNHVAIDADDIQSYNANTPNTLYLNYFGGNVQISNASVGSTTTVYGTFVNNSDRNAKEDIKPAESRQILERLVQLPVGTWKYKGSKERRHVGPMAQDFHTAFDELLDLNSDDKTIAPLDEAGVAFASIQALHGLVEEKTAAVSKLEAENAALKERLDRLERAVLEIRSGNVR